MLKELDGTNQSIVSYTYGDDLISQSRAGAESYYLYDGHGSTRSLTDSSGNTLNTYAYNAYGVLIDSTGSAENSYLYAGEQFDANLSNYYLRARYYDPSIGRFTALDTWMGNNSDPISLHKYAYGNLDPVNGIDPSGHYTLTDAMTTVNTLNNVASYAQTAQDLFSFLMGNDSDEMQEGNGGFSLFDFIMVGIIQSVAGSSSNAISETAVPVPSVYSLNAGRNPKHHTIPIYVCGHDEQQKSTLNRSDHNEIHRKLYGFVKAVDVAGYSFNLLFKRPRSRAVRTPTQQLARTAKGRTAIVAALGAFYRQFGYSELGLPSVRYALTVEGPRFIAGHTSYRQRCQRRR